MKKIYSFVLMATMLFVGTNVWAGTYNVGSTSDFETYWAKSATEDVVLNLTSSAVNLNKIMWLGSDHSVVLNLNDNELTVSGTSYGFLLTRGSLTINGAGTITASCGNELFYITGSNAQVTDYTTLTIGNGVAISYSTYKAAISVDAIMNTSNGAYKAYATSACVPQKAALDYTTKIGSTKKGEAMGVKVEIDGTISAQKYAVKTNGDLGYVEANKAYAPYIHIQPNAQISVLATTAEAKKPMALYASGYANWKIEGHVTGNVGVMVKSGDVDINGATIQSTNTENYTGANESTSGSTAQGSAIIISSEVAYTGEMDVTISGNAQITAGKGYAVEESVATPNNPTKVDVITVESATFEATPQSQGAVIISNETATAAVGGQENVEIEIVSATVNGTLTVTGDDTQGTMLQEFTQTSAVIPNDPADPKEGSVIVPLEVKLTSDGYASFSAPINLYKATGKDGYVPFGIYTGILNGDVLVLNEVGYVKAGQGVILYAASAASAANTIKCFFTTSGGEDSSVFSNDLKPSSAWTTNSGSVYCLRNVTGTTMLYQYTGASMPANKAYLDLGPAPAPARIRMVFSETQGIEDAEATVKALKFIENGQVLIKRGERVYNVQGQIVK